jgi:cysteine sulfinate desulfinase/cysteine desulfurase-like protein
LTGDGAQCSAVRTPAAARCPLHPQQCRTCLPPASSTTREPQAFHQTGFDNLQAAMQRTRKLCATVMDTQGPEIVVLNW